MAEEMLVVPIQMAGQKIQKELYSDKGFEEYALNRLRKIFEAEGSLRPIAEIMVTRDPETREIGEDYVSLVMTPATDDFGARTTEFFSRVIRQIIFDLDAVSYMFTSEVWMVRGPLEPMKTQPADAPGRQECLCVILEFKSDYSTKIYIAPITRPDENTVRLGEWELAGTEGHVAGKFTGMFRTSTEVS